MLRLLQKEEIQKHKAEEKRLEILEGLKLAKRVDSLREIQAQEEASLEEFRKKTLENIHAEITSKAQERDTLIGEVVKLEHRRKEALKPLVAEWDEVRVARERLDKERTEISARENTLTHRQRDVELTEKVSADEFGRALVERERANQLLVEAADHEKQAEKALKDAEAIKYKTGEFKQNVTGELKSRDIELAARERSLDIQEVSVKKREDALADRERAINDKYATLMRIESYGKR